MRHEGNPLALEPHGGKRRIAAKYAMAEVYGLDVRQGDGFPKRHRFTVHKKLCEQAVWRVYGLSPFFSVSIINTGKVHGGKL